LSRDSAGFDGYERHCGAVCWAACRACADAFAGLDFKVNYPLPPSKTRDYNPTLGRWLVPDPAGQMAVDPANPQTWNMYAYVGDNPTTLNDPLGLESGGADCSNWSGGYTVGMENRQFTIHDNDNVNCLGDGDGFVYLYSFHAPNLGGFDTSYQYRYRNTALVAALERQLREEQCAGQALKKNGVALSLDVAGVGAGFLPGGDAVVAGVQVAASTGGMMYSSAHYDSPGTALNAGAFAITAITPAAKAIGGDIARSVPVVGAIFSAAGILNDVRHVYKDYESCMAGHS